MPSYKIKKLLCDGTTNGGAAWSEVPIVEPGTLIPDIGVLFISSILRADGANQGQATLRIGAGPTPDPEHDIPLFLLGQNFHSTPGDNEGVFFSCPVLAAGTMVIFLIGFQVAGAAPL